MTDWTLVSFDSPKMGGASVPPVVSKKAERINGHCSLCGKKLGKGAHFHLKSCKGIDDGNLR